MYTLNICRGRIYTTKDLLTGSSHFYSVVRPIVPHELCRQRQYALILMLPSFIHLLQLQSTVQGLPLVATGSPLDCSEERMADEVDITNAHGQRLTEGGKSAGNDLPLTKSQRLRK